MFDYLAQSAFFIILFYLGIGSIIFLGVDIGPMFLQPIGFVIIFLLAICYSFLFKL